MLYKFSYERLRTQASDSARRDQAIELRAVTEVKAVAALLVPLMASDNGVARFQDTFLSRLLKLVSIWIEAIFNNCYTLSTTSSSGTLPVFITKRVGEVKLCHLMSCSSYRPCTISLSTFCGQII